MRNERNEFWGAALLSVSLSGGCFSVPDEPAQQTDTDNSASTDDSTSTSADDGTGPGSDDGESTSTAEPNAAPLALPDGPYLSPSHEPLTIEAAQGLLLNDDDPDADPLSVRAGEVTTQAGGTAQLSADGGFSYLAPASLPFGTDRFEYVVLDERGQEATAEVRVVVGPSDDGVELAGLNAQGRPLVGASAEDQAGRSLAGVGDVDGDGFDDVAVVTSRTMGAEIINELVLIYGGTTRSELSLEQADVRFSGLVATNPSVAAAGDVDGDGFDDFLVGDQAYEGGVGCAYLVLGSPELGPLQDLSTDALRLEGITPGDRAGIAVAGAGDFDGDGFDDVLVGADQANVEIGGSETNPIYAQGEAYLVRGHADLSAGQVISLADADVHLDGRMNGGRAGVAVAGVGDLNDDGFDEIAIGAPFASPNGNAQAGEVYIVHGSPAPTELLELVDADVRIKGTQSHTRVGSALSGADDVDGDGRHDLLVGASHDDIGGGNAGAAYLILGATTLSDVENLRDVSIRLEGRAPGDQAGSSLHGVGDFDGDGLADLLIGAALANPIDDDATGEAYLVLGQLDPEELGGQLAADLRLQGSAAADRAGRTVRSAGDFDGDGFDDLLIAAHAFDAGNEPNAGAAFVVFGDDLRATVSTLGTTGDDTLPDPNPEVAEVLVGGRGDDILMGRAGDVLRGGAGDDTLVVEADGIFRVDGGRGYDTLELADDVDLELANVDLRVRGIERVRLASSGSASLSLSEASLRRLSSITDTLVVEGIGSIVLTSGTWSGPQQEGDDAVYRSEQSTALLRVAPGIDVTLP